MSPQRSCQRYSLLCVEFHRFMGMIDASRSGWVLLEVELHGAEDAPALLIPGMGMPLIDRSLGLVEALTDQGFRVVRCDSRDVGLSTPVNALGRASVASA